MTITTTVQQHESASRRSMCRALVFASTFPSSVQPIHGVFVKERVRHVAALPNCEVQVVSPVPYFPPIRAFPRWYPLSQYQHAEQIDGLPVIRPRYFLLPKVGKYFHPRSMARAARPAMERLAEHFEFDLVDAHFLYPDGVAAMHLARHFDRPLVITGRGEDVLTCPSDPSMRAGIREALAVADQLIAVSDEIATAMENLGAEPGKITVIPNGVDTDRFRPLDQAACRQQLGLPADRPIVISVGYLLERKGYHLLVDAVAHLRETYPDLLTLIVGGVARWGQDYTEQIEARIAAHGLHEHVRMVGPRPPEELPQWYGAADLFALLTSREGCPNALLEALSAGLPAVATRIGQIPQVLEREGLGILLPERSAAAGAEGIRQALERNWDRTFIREEMERKSWRATAMAVRHVFDRALNPGNLSAE